MLRPELWVQRIGGQDVVRECLAAVPTPAAEDLARREGALRPPGSAPTRGWRPSACWPRSPSGGPELAALGAPFAAFLAALGALEGGDPELSCRVELERERVLEGDEVEVDVHVATQAAIERLELALVLPSGLYPTGACRVVAAVAAGEERELRVGLRPRRWGGWRVGDVTAISAGVLGMVRREGRFSGRLPLRAYPREDTLRRLIAPADTQPAAGSRVARVRRGDRARRGAAVRARRPLRRINWRASARRGTLIRERPSPGAQQPTS